MKKSFKLRELCILAVLFSFCLLQLVLARYQFRGFGIEIFESYWLEIQKAAYIILWLSLLQLSLKCGLAERAWPSTGKNTLSTCASCLC